MGRPRKNEEKMDTTPEEIFGEPIAPDFDETVDTVTPDEIPEIPENEEDGEDGEDIPVIPDTTGLFPESPFSANVDLYPPDPETPEENNLEVIEEPVDESEYVSVTSEANFPITYFDGKRYVTKLFSKEQATHSLPKTVADTLVLNKLPVTLA